MTAVHNVALFLTGLFFSFCVFVVLLRILLQFFRASVTNPICQFVANVTNPIVQPFKRILPRIQSIDLASVLVLFIIEILKFSIISFLQNGYLNLFFLLIISLTDMILQTLDILFYAIIVRVILSWVNPASTAYLNEIIYLMTEPLLSKMRRIIPAISGIDLSPLLALILLKVVNIILLSYLPG